MGFKTEKKKKSQYIAVHNMELILCMAVHVF